MYYSSPCLTGSHECRDKACVCICHTKEQGEAEKVRHQFARAVKLADAIMFKLNSNAAEFSKMLERTKLDQWTQLAILCGIDTPSLTTQALALKIMEDREHYVTMIQSTGREQHAERAKGSNRRSASSNNVRTARRKN